MTRPNPKPKLAPAPETGAVKAAVERAASKLPKKSITGIFSTPKGTKKKPGICTASCRAASRRPPCSYGPN
jgi:hypothetical protein